MKALIITFLLTLSFTTSAAMDKVRLGTALKAAVLALNPNAGGMSGAETAQLQAYMEAIADEIIKEIKANADIDLPVGQIPVGPGSFANGAGPVSGVGSSNAVLIQGKIK